MANLPPHPRKRLGQHFLIDPNRIRGVSPWPGGYTFVEGERWGIWKVQVEEPEGDWAGVSKNAPHTPGTIIGVTKQGIHVQTGQGVLRLIDIQPANRKRLAVGDYLAGHRMEVGTLLSQAPSSSEISKKVEQS